MVTFNRISAVEENLKHLYLESMSGDREKYERFLTMLSSVVKKYLLFLSKNGLSADLLDDLHQEVLLSIHEKKHTYRIDKPILPWVYAITRHRFIDFYRSMKRTPDLVEFHDIALEEELNKISLEEILAFLTQEQQEMLVMVKIEGESYEDAARKLHSTPENLKVKIHRLLKSIRKKYESL